MQAGGDAEPLGPGHQLSPGPSLGAEPRNPRSGFAPFLTGPPANLLPPPRRSAGASTGVERGGGVCKTTVSPAARRVPVPHRRVRDVLDPRDAVRDPGCSALQPDNAQGENFDRPPGTPNQVAAPRVSCVSWCADFVFRGAHPWFVSARFSVPIASPTIRLAQVEGDGGGRGQGAAPIVTFAAQRVSECGHSSGGRGSTDYDPPPQTPC